MIDVKVQIVAGLKYRVAFTKARTSCSLAVKTNFLIYDYDGDDYDDDYNFASCQPDLDTLEECMVEFWVQPWNPDVREIMTHQCESL